MSEQVIEKYGINFEERAKQILSTEPILAAKDLEVQFTLRGEKLNAIRKCSLELYDGETLAIVGESGSGKSVLPSALWACWIKTAPSPAVPSCITARI